MKSSLRFLPALFLSFALLVAACGDDGDSESAEELSADTATSESSDGGDESSGGESDADDGEGAMDGAEDGSEDDGEGAMDGAEDGPIVSVSSPQYEKDFTLTGCDNPTETTLSLRAEADDIVLQVDATDGVGTLFITGGNEQDGVDLAGTVTSVTVGDAGNVTVEGTFDSDDGQAFTITGSCI